MNTEDGGSISSIFEMLSSFHLIIPTTANVNTGWEYTWLFPSSICRIYSIFVKLQTLSFLVFRYSAPWGLNASRDILGEFGLVALCRLCFHPRIFSLQGSEDFLLHPRMGILTTSSELPLDTDEASILDLWSFNLAHSSLLSTYHHSILGPPLHFIRSTVFIRKITLALK